MHEDITRYTHFNRYRIRIFTGLQFAGGEKNPAVKMFCPAEGRYKNVNTSSWRYHFFEDSLLLLLPFYLNLKYYQ